MFVRSHLWTVGTLSLARAHTRSAYALDDGTATINKLLMIGVKSWMYASDTLLRVADQVRFANRDKRAGVECSGDRERTRVAVQLDHREGH